MFQISPSVSLSGTVFAYLLNMFSKLTGMYLEIEMVMEMEMR